MSEHMGTTCVQGWLSSGRCGAASDSDLSVHYVEVRYFGAIWVSF